MTAMPFEFMGINFLEEQAPDATTLLHFRRMMEESKIGEQLFRASNYVIEQSGYLMRGGTIVEATIINAPCSTKNVKKACDPEMHQTKKGNEWRFGMKCHAGVDVGSGLVHTIEFSAANVHDINVAAKFIREDNEVVYDDSGDLRIEKREEIQSGEHLSAIDYRINRWPGKLPKVSDNAIAWERSIENRKSSMRCKVEHFFHIIKNLFGYSKAVYQGLSKNWNRLHMLCASANLLVLARARRRLRRA